MLLTVFTKMSGYFWNYKEYSRFKMALTRLAVKINLFPCYSSTPWFECLSSWYIVLTSKQTTLYWLNLIEGDISDKSDIVICLIGISWDWKVQMYCLININVASDLKSCCMLAIKGYCLNIIYIDSLELLKVISVIPMLND